ncbi:MAG: TonB family protein [Bryobacterales bacterium]|nr:TonB family protein [Bryobacterales bacterium]
MRRPSHLLSLVIHAGAVFALLHLTAIQQLPRNRKQPPSTWSSTKLTWHLPEGNSKGGGSGRMTIPPSRGALPRTAPRQFLMPTVRQSDDQPLLPVEPTLEGVPQPRVTGLAIGDPTALAGPPSDGIGGRGGIGTGGEGGVGNRSGPGSGDGEGGGIQGQSQTLRITQPVLVYKVEPEFSEEGRKARVQGVVVLAVVVDEQGRVARIHVRASLGLGLDEKAIEAVKKWRFRPATRNGRPVSAPAIIEVSFHLL